MVEPNGNYKLKLAALQAEGKLAFERGKAYLIGVAHDGFCGALKTPQQDCNCDPDISFNGKVIEPDGPWRNPRLN